ncbi:MAG: PilZ domain-containing protein [Nitrospirota bacterium]
MEALEKEYPRKRVDARSVIHVTPVMDALQNFIGYAKNISRSGMMIHTYAALEEGREFIIEFRLPESDVKVKCRARIVWSRTFSKSRASINRGGLLFMEIEPALQKRIDLWISAQG